MSVIKKWNGIFLKIAAVCALLAVTGCSEKPDTAAQPVQKKALIPASARDDFFNGAPANQVLVDKDYYVWGLTAFRWNDGKVHAYYSRWPRATGFNGWMTHCEIAHAVADSPAGPFATTGTVIESRHLEGWDIVNAHNPAVTVVDGKIHLYYISNQLRGDFEPQEGNPFPSDQWLLDNRRDIVRNRQRIGLASADSPEGPFVRTREPVVVPHGNFKNIAVNPAVTYQNGQFVMIAKGDDQRKEGIFRIQLVGHADRAEGPYVFQQQPIYDKAQTEDASIWYDRTEQRFNSLVHVMGKPELAHLVSDDGVNWREGTPFTYLHKTFELSDGTTWTPKRFERPFVLTDKQGRAEWLYVAVLDKGISGNIAVPLQDD
ncbi:glycoside hydrolase family protein [Porticoccus sp. GXU_MW_L64]